MPLGGLLREPGVQRELGQQVRGRPAGSPWPASAGSCRATGSGRASRMWQGQRRRFSCVPPGRRLQGVGEVARDGALPWAGSRTSGGLSGCLARSLRAHGVLVEPYWGRQAIGPGACMSRSRIHCSLRPPCLSPNSAMNLRRATAAFAGSAKSASWRLYARYSIHSTNAG